MGTVAASGTKIPIGDALYTAILGYAVVFLGIVLLMVVVIIVGKIMTNKAKKAAPAPVKTEEVKTVSEKAPGTAGGVKLYDTPERDAAMIMAIVADNLGKPLNELRFISIREVK